MLLQGRKIGTSLFLLSYIQMGSEKEAYYEKPGVTHGTALAFMMVVTALSLSEMIILRKGLRFRLLTVFVKIMTITIVAVAYLFNAIM